MSQPYSRSPSRSPSPVSDHDDRAPNKAALSRSPSVASQHDDGAPNETTQLPRRPRRRLGHPRSSSSEVSDQDDRRQGMPIPDEVKDTDRAATETADGTINKVDETTGEVVGGGDNEEGDDGHPVKLKLDLNLDVDVEVEARVRGDLTLSLL